MVVVMLVVVMVVVVVIVVVRNKQTLSKMSNVKSQLALAILVALSCQWALRCTC